jgi:uncharacterized protein (AIM24 family)/tetratricopeptide (TPR) repeat protein
MSPPAPPANFDEGIFLVHLNKGKDLLGRGALQDAREELEKARSLRPGEAKVLNLLGMLYFKLEAHSEAREVYSRLIAIHPNEAVLHSNLGIVEFKEGRLEEAETHLRRALEIDPANLKPHQYLGLLYNKRGDLDRAAEHLRRAGLTKMLEKVEAKRRQQKAEEGSGRGLERTGADFRVRADDVTHSAPVIPPAGESLPAAPDIDAVLAGLSALTEGPASVEMPSGLGSPVSSGGEEPDLLGNLLSSLGASEADSPAAAAAPAPPSAPAPPVFSPARPAPRPPAPVVPGGPIDLGAAPVPAARLGGELFGPFRRPGPGLVEMRVGSRAFIRRGSVAHYSGRLDFQRERASGLVLVQGQGTLFLGDEGHQALLLELAGQSIAVSAARLLAASDGVQVEPLPLGPSGGGAELRALRVGGHGCVAFLVRGEPLCLDVEPERPTAADPRLVVAWSGELRAQVNASEILRDVMAAGARGLLSLRFEGRGNVLAEHPEPSGAASPTSS